MATLSSPAEYNRSMAVMSLWKRFSPSNDYPEDNANYRGYEPEKQNSDNRSQ